MRQTILSVVALTAAVAAQAPNSILDRGDTKLNSTPGVATTNGLGGFGSFDVAAIPQLIRATGSSVASPRVVYSTYVDGDGAGGVGILFRVSDDGGRTWGTPSVLYSLDVANGESLATGGAQVQLRCSGDDVYVTFLTNRDDLPGAGGSNLQGIYVLGSGDRGLTWTAPLRVTTNQGIGGTQKDIDELRTVAVQDGLHVAFEYDTPTIADEILGYAKINFDAMGALQFAVAEKDLSTFAPGTADVDNPSIDADGSIVHVVWNDNFTGGNETYSVTSTDGGVTFGAPFPHTSGAVSLGDLTFAAVDGGRAYSFSQHSGDQVFMDRADVDTVAGTVTWNVSQVAATPATVDVDSYQVAVKNGIVAVLFEDDRSGANETFMSIDNNGGDDMVAGTYKETLLSTQNPTPYSVQIRGDVVGAVWEECAFPEGAAIALSADRGETFQTTHFTSQDSCSGGSYDVDDVRLALTGNDDYVVVYADERDQPGNNDFEGIYATGGKYPFFTDDTVASGTLTMNKVDPTQSMGSFALLLLAQGNSGTLVPVIGGAPNDYGIFVGLDNDMLFQVSLDEVTATARSIDATGTATWTGIPAISNLLGVDIYCVGGTVDLALADVWRSYTDPIIVGR